LAIRREWLALPAFRTAPLHMHLRAELDDAIARLSGPRAAELARVPTAPLAAELTKHPSGHHCNMA
jgi:hypothetical protein